MLEGDEGEVDDLNERPEHPVGLEGRPPGGLDSLLGVVSFHGGHAAKEDADHDGCKGELIASHTSESFNLSVARVDVASEETKPGCRNGAKDDYRELISDSNLVDSLKMLTATVQGHATCSNQVMLLHALLLDELLSRDITSSKEHRSGDALGEQRASSQAGVVPE